MRPISVTFLLRDRQEAGLCFSGMSGPLGITGGTTPIPHCSLVWIFLYASDLLYHTLGMGFLAGNNLLAHCVRIVCVTICSFEVSVGGKWRKFLLNYAISKNVVDLIPNMVNFLSIYVILPIALFIDLGVDSASNRNEYQEPPGGKRRLARKDENFTAVCSRLSRRCVILDLHKFIVSVACYRDSLIFKLITLATEYLRITFT
jgi:hypothetical protein